MKKNLLFGLAVLLLTGFVSCNNTTSKEKKNHPDG